MPSDLNPYDDPVPLTRREQRAVAAVRTSTGMRVADVHAHGIVQTERMREIDRLAREAASGQAMLHQWAATLAQGDAFLADELQHFVGLARLGKSEIMIDTIHRFSRGGS